MRFVAEVADIRTGREKRINIDARDEHEARRKLEAWGNVVASLSPDGQPYADIIAGASAVRAYAVAVLAVGIVIGVGCVVCIAAINVHNPAWLALGLLVGIAISTAAAGACIMLRMLAALAIAHRDMTLATRSAAAHRSRQDPR